MIGEDSPEEVDLLTLIVHFVELIFRPSCLATLRKLARFCSCSSSFEPYTTISSLIPTHPSHRFVILSMTLEHVLTDVYFERETAEAVPS